MLQDDHIVTWHLGTKVVIGAIFLCIALLSVHKKTAANCDRLIVDWSVFSCHRNFKPFLIKRLQVSAVLSIVQFVGCEIFYHSMYFQAH
jgi:hypothetical protein